MLLIMDKDALTPVTTGYMGIMLKRDDLFVPFEDIPLSGGKVRQCLCLLKNNLDRIKSEYNSTVVTVANVDSPQAIIVSRCARHFGLKSIVVIAGKTKLSQTCLLRNLVATGAELDMSVSVGYPSALNAAALRHNAFYVKYGINLETDPAAIIGSISRQCENIPADLDVLVVPVGSGVSLAGVLQGLKLFNRRPKRVVGVQISGKDITADVERMTGENGADFELRVITDIPYHRKTYCFAAEECQLDPLYEAKAWIRAADLMVGRRSLFWVVGNTIPVRSKVYVGER